MPTDPRRGGAVLGSRERLLALYDVMPFHRHPLWRAILGRDLSLKQVLKAEVQHYIRTRAGQVLRREALEHARGLSAVIWEAILETYLEECTDQITASHLALIERLLTIGGIQQEELDTTPPTIGNAAAIALYRDISGRGPACHLLGAGAVEHFYSRLSPDIYRVYTEHYGMSPHQAETYAIHGPMDRQHADRAFRILEEAIRAHGWPAIETSVRDAFAATSLHYDGMLQAALGHIVFWDGR